MTPPPAVLAEPLKRPVESAPSHDPGYLVVSEPAPELTVWTIGHSAAEIDELFRLLLAQRIQVLVDVRSSPYSQHAPQANRECLEHAAAARHVTYRYCGTELGGRPSDPAMLLSSGKADYSKMELAPEYRRGIEGLVALARERRACLLCSEEDPVRCHRALLISETLTRQGHRVLHIRHDGSVEPHADLQKRRTGGQLSFF